MASHRLNGRAEVNSEGSVVNGEAWRANSWLQRVRQRLSDRTELETEEVNQLSGGSHSKSHLQCRRLGFDKLVWEDP